MAPQQSPCNSAEEKCLQRTAHQTMDTGADKVEETENSLDEGMQRARGLGVPTKSEAQAGGEVTKKTSKSGKENMADNIQAFKDKTDGGVSDSKHKAEPVMEETGNTRKHSVERRKEHMFVSKE